MKIEKEMVVNEKNEAVDDRQWLEKEIFVSYEEILDVTPEIFVEAKILLLGHLVTDLKRENEELQACTVLSTTPK